jgi:hypothetical protein
MGTSHRAVLGVFASVLLPACDGLTKIAATDIVQPASLRSVRT